MKQKKLLIIVVLVFLVLFLKQQPMKEIKKQAGTPLLVDNLWDYVDNINIEPWNGINVISLTTNQVLIDGAAQILHDEITLDPPEAIKVEITPGTICSPNAQFSIYPLNLGKYVTVYLPPPCSGNYYVASTGETYSDEALTQDACTASNGCADIVCTPDCSCASSTCIGQTCLEDCGGTCDGTLQCTTCPSNICTDNIVDYNEFIDTANYWIGG